MSDLIQYLPYLAPVFIALSVYGVFKKQIDGAVSRLRPKPAPDWTPPADVAPSREDAFSGFCTFMDYVGPHLSAEEREALASFTACLTRECKHESA